MKKLLLLLCIVCTLSSCYYRSNSPRGSYARGADLSWLTEMESDSVSFYNLNGEQQDCLDLLQSIGMNAVRFRVWVNHTTGWCNKDEVVEKSIRAARKGLRIMIDFHYSDNFADPQQQNIPLAWREYDFDLLCAAVREHTLDVLQTLKENRVYVEWVQVGNETTNGMLWPIGKLTDGAENTDGCWERYATLTEVGYQACKEVFPKTTVIVHIDNAYMYRGWFFENLKKFGAHFDMIGLSHYPMMLAWNGGKSWQEMNTLADANIRRLIAEYHKPVMVAEVGTSQDNDSLAAQVMQDFVNRIADIDSCAGIFYWEPECYNQWKPKEYDALGWGPYLMGAFTEEGKPAPAMQIMLAEK
ncbi:MAG: glycosyl hydrolase 53 family protein [Paludibacteraceae bacterium]|nr:glycosyl hydrolase 53 family protein [Paludibacteraceae bacterium]